MDLASREALSKGVTTFHDAGADFERIDGYRRLAESGYLESVGYRVGEPQWDELFGNASRIVVPSSTGI